MADLKTQETLPEASPEFQNAVRQKLLDRINAMSVQSEVQRVLGKQTVDTVADIKKLADSSNEHVRLLFARPIEHGAEKFEVKQKEIPKDEPAKDGKKKEEPTKEPEKSPAKDWHWYNPISWPATKATGTALLKAGEFTAGATAATLPFVFETSRNFILNIPLLGDALKGAATLGEPLAKALQLPALQSGITSGITASVTTGAETLKGIYGLGWLGKTLAALNPAATAIAPYILPTALTGGGLYGLGKFSDWMHNLAGKKTEKAGLFKTMWRGVITPVTLPWLAVTKAPTLVKKGYDVTKKVTAPLFRHKIGTYGGAFLGYSVLAGLTGGMAIPWAIAGGLGGRYIQKRWFTGKSATPKLEAAPEH